MEENVRGLSDLIAKQSAVNEAGRLRESPIDGGVFRPARPVPHTDGHVTEVARASWPELTAEVVQVHITTTLPGRTRAWGLHQRSTDRLFVVSGLVRIVVFDGRTSSPSYGRVNQFTVSEKTPGLLIIPPNLYHGWRNIGITEAIIINMPDRMYNYEAPDALDLPWDSPDAPQIVEWLSKAPDSPWERSSRRLSGASSRTSQWSGTLVGVPASSLHSRREP